jgi:hypothetical protein
MKVKPVLGDWEIPHIETIHSLEQRAFIELPVPGRVGSLYQDLNTVPARVVVRGSVYGDDKRDDFLNQVRGKFRDGAPLTFVGDIVTATSVQYVVIESLEIAEVAARPDQSEYVIVLRESPPPPPPPDPLGGLDTGLLDEAKGAVDAAAGALDAINALSNIPDIGNPTKPLLGTVDTVKTATQGLGQVVADLESIFQG